MHEVIKPLMGQIVQWIIDGQVAANKIVHVGIPQARAIVRNKAGKKTEFGLAYLISRLGGGYLFGERIAANADESADAAQGPSGVSRDLWSGRDAGVGGLRPGWRLHGDPPAARARGVKEVGMQPKGKRPWSVAEAVREQIRSERGQTEGIIGTLKSDTIQVQQAQGTSLADAGDGGAEVYPLVQSEQVYAGLVRVNR